MLSAFGRALRTPDLRRKLGFTLALIVLYRLGTFIPAPGVDYGNVQQCLALGRSLAKSPYGQYVISVAQAAGAGG